jgi:hypothetical protein
MISFDQMPFFENPGNSEWELFHS